MTEINNGFYGEFGGCYVPEVVKEELDRIADFYEDIKDDPDFKQELALYLRDYVGRENPLYYAENFSKHLGGPKIYLKREDLNHLGAHKVNNTIGQVLIAKRMGKKRLIAETGAGQHGVATAAVAAKFGMECTVYMGQKDVERQKLNVFRMELMGTKVVGVKRGAQSLKEAVDAAFEDLIDNYQDTYYLVGSAVGPHLYPSMVKHFQSVISQESKAQILEREGRLPDAVVACIGGGSNAIGSFAHYLDEPSVKLYGAEGGGKGLDSDQTAATLNLGSIKIEHGMNTYCLVDEEGNTKPSYSISAGLDYVAIGPEHAYLKDSHRAEYIAITDDEALAAFQLLSHTEGIIPALESSHALALAAKLAPQYTADQILLVTLSGRGDKDVDQVLRILES